MAPSPRFLRARSRKVFTSVKNGLAFEFCLSIGVFSWESHFFQTTFIHRRPGIRRRDLGAVRVGRNPKPMSSIRRHAFPVGMVESAKIPAAALRAATR